MTSASPRFDPAGYPGPRPPGPSLVHDGTVHPVRVARDLGPDGVLRIVTDVPAATVTDAHACRWSVAYGANASPDGLRDKRLDVRGAVLLPAVADGWVAAWEQRRTSYGSVPLTFVPSHGARSQVWLLGVHVDDTIGLDASEGRGPAAGTTGAPIGAYRLGVVGDVHVVDGPVLHDALAYLPGPATRIQVAADGQPRSWPTVDQVDASRHLDVRGPSRLAAVDVLTVDGPWPTPRWGPPPSGPPAT